MQPTVALPAVNSSPAVFPLHLRPFEPPRLRGCMQRVAEIELLFLQRTVLECRIVMISVHRKLVMACCHVVRVKFVWQCTWSRVCSFVLLATAGHGPSPHINQLIRILLNTVVDAATAPCHKSLACVPGRRDVVSKYMEGRSYSERVP